MREGLTATRLSPLDGVLRRHGATMIVRAGRCVAAHFGSPTSETAVCLSTVGIADRSDRTTFELSGAPLDIDAALAAIEACASSVRTGSRSAIIRCNPADGPACVAALRSADVAVEPSERFAAIQVIGPRAAELVRALDASGGEETLIVLEACNNSYEVLVEAQSGPALWARLLDGGASLSVACVGLDALEHLAASRRLSRSASQTRR